MKKTLLLSTLILMATVAQSWAQGCSVCTKTASELGEKGADGLNNGIIYLAFLPLTFMAVIGYLWWKHNRSVNS